MPLGIDAQHRRFVFEQNGRGVPEVLAGFPINDYLSSGLVAEVDRWNRDRRKGFPSGALLRASAAGYECGQQRENHNGS